MTTPDIGIQKSTILKQDLPLLDSDRKYFLRYRIKSKNGPATTAWSPVYRVAKPSIQGLSYTVQKEIKSHGKSFDVSWKILPSIPEQINLLPLDVYVKWDNETTWNFVTTTTTNSFSVPIPTAYQSTATVSHTASFMVHLATFNKDRLPTDVETLIFTATNVLTRAQYDAGSLV